MVEQITFLGDRQVKRNGIRAGWVESRLAVETAIRQSKEMSVWLRDAKRAARDALATAKGTQ